MHKPYVKYIAALLLFGSNGIVASHIHMNSYEIVLLRTLLGSLLLAALFVFSKRKFTFPKHKKALLFLCASGIAMGTSWMFLYEAYSQIGVGIASLLYYTGPVLVMILSPILFKEKLTVSMATGFLAVLAGIVLVNGSSFGGGAKTAGILLGLLSAVMYAVMVIANKKAAGISGMENSVLQLVISFLTVAVFVGFRTGFVMRIQAEDWIWILILGFVNTGIGCYLYFSSIGRLPVQTVAVCGYLEPLSAVLLSALILGEEMLPFQILGAALILSGAIFGECFGKKPKSH